MFFFGVLAVFSALMTLVSSFMYTRHGMITKKTLVVSGAYGMALWIAMAAIVFLWKPTYASVAILVLVLGALSTILYVGCSYFNLMLAEKGPRAMFRSVQQFIRRSLTWRHPNR